MKKKLSGEVWFEFLSSRYPSLTRESVAMDMERLGLDYPLLASHYGYSQEELDEFLGKGVELEIPGESPEIVPGE